MSEFANRLLSKVKLTLREPSDNFNDDIKADIDASAMDLMQAGILPYFFEVTNDSWEVDPLILRAVKWYCLSVYGLYNTDMEKYDTAYRSLKATLATQTRYSRKPDDPLVDAEIRNILNLIESLDERLTEVENSGGAGGGNGKDGVGIKSVEQTTTSTEDNGKNVITVTLTNGNKSTFVVENGSQGSQGRDGNDYVLTNDDKTDIANLVLGLLPNGDEVRY